MPLRLDRAVCFAWNLVDLKRVCWEGSELTPGRNQLEFDFKYGGLGAAIRAFGDYSDGAHPSIHPGVWRGSFGHASSL
jgi:hypothetical protein